MARVKSKALKPILFPTLEPWEFIWIGLGKPRPDEGYFDSQEELYFLSGWTRTTWQNWLYRGTRAKRETKERLYNIANDMGWLSEDVAA